MPFEKGNPGRPKGTKNKATLDREMRRRVFDEKVSAKWDQIIDKLMANEEKYVADQFIGKARETLDVNAQIDFIFDEDKVE